jgi:hypothetical protein
MRLAPMALAAVLLASGCFGGKEETQLGCGAPVACGDVDGDETMDQVQVDGTRLIVRTHDEDLTLSLPAGEFPPFLNGLAAIDRRPGLEIVATLHRGASTSFAGVFAVRRGRLRQLAIPGNESGDLFAYEGGVTHFDSIDCSAPGVVVATSSTPGHTEERTYRVEDAGFRLIRSRTRRRQSFVTPQPFPSCMRIRSG